MFLVVRKVLLVRERNVNRPIVIKMIVNELKSKFFFLLTDVTVRI